MSIDFDPARQHDWQKITVTPMMLTAEGDLVPRGNPTRTEVGCFNCNMGFDEGKDVNCPGQDLFDPERLKT